MKTISIKSSILILLCMTLMAQSDDNYYKTIQKKNKRPIPVDQFKKLEETAYLDYSNPDNYPPLAKAFGGSEEKLWAIVYAEMYCNMTKETLCANQMGTFVFSMYKTSIQMHTYWMESYNDCACFYFKFQLSQMKFMDDIILEEGADEGNVDFPPLTIKKLMDIRRNQLSETREVFPSTMINNKTHDNIIKNGDLFESRFLSAFGNSQYILRLKTILDSGNYEAYSYWLFQGAQPKEFNTWLINHKDQYQVWLDWAAKNPMILRSPDFQRPYFLK